MSEWVKLEVIDGIGPVAVKHRRPTEDQALLDHEARVLADIDHPGVVRLVERRRGTDAALVTHFIGTHSLATTPVLGIDDVLDLVAALAHTLEDLHRLGVRHGAIDPSHVLLGPGRRPVLCGFSGATPPGTDPEVPPLASDDIAGLGRVMSGVLAGHDGLEPIPGRRAVRTRHWQGYRQRALLSLADHCQADDARARPSASSLAPTIDDLVELAPARPLRGAVSTFAEAARSSAQRVRSAMPSAARPSTTDRRRTRRTLIGALGAVGVMCALMAVRVFVTSSGPATTAGALTGAAAPTTTPPQPLHRPPGSRSATTDLDPATTVAPPPTPPTDDCPPGRPSRGADIDNDHCADGPVELDGRVATVNGHQFDLGRPGDRVFAGDWNCDGLITVVVARDEPAALWHFPVWASPEVTSTPDLVMVEIDPARLETTRLASGCDQLVAATTNDPTPRPVEIAP